MNSDTRAIKADIALTRARIEGVVDELEHKVADTKQRFSIKMFVKRHRVALGVCAVALTGTTWLLLRAIRHAWPVRVYFGVKSVSSLLTPHR